jgi:hypothetical protein
MSPGLYDVCDVLPVRRCKTDSDAEKWQLRMGIVPAMEFRDRLRIDISGFGADQNPLLEMSFENALERDKEGLAVVAMPVGVSPRRDFRVVDLNLHRWITGKRRIKLIEKNVAMQLLAGFSVTGKLQLQLGVIFGWVHISNNMMR